MPNDVFLPITKTVTTTENVGVTLKSLHLESAALNSPGKFELELAPLDGGGAWLDGARSVFVRREDALFETDPLLKYAASAFHSIMLNAKINVTDPATANFIALVRSTGVTVTGEETVKEFSKMIIPLVLTP